MPYTLRSVGDIKDEIDFNRGVLIQGCAIVDLGTLNWAMSATSDFAAYLPTTRYWQKDRTKNAYFLNSYYSTVPFSTYITLSSNKVCSQSDSSARVCIYDTEYTDVENVDIEYIEKLVFLNTDLIGKDESEANENGIMYFTYPEINQVAVKLLGKEVHNKFPNKTGDYFEKTTDGFSVVGMCGSETIAEKYVIDKIQKGSNGLFYIDMYDYTTEYEFLSFDVTIEDSGKKVYTKDANGKKVFEYTLDVIPYSEMDVTLKYLDSEGNEVTEEQMDEIVKENLDKLVKRTIVLEYDEELDLYYMKSNVLEKKAK
jgi:hypothetical protein